MQMERKGDGINVQPNPTIKEHLQSITIDCEVLTAGLTLNKSVNPETLEEVSDLTAQVNPEDRKSVIVRCLGKRAGGKGQVPDEDWSITGSVWAVLKANPSWESKP